jgi:PIN domain nuclease of toxin-antitoxin system
MKGSSVRLEKVFYELDTNPAFRIIPLTTDIAYEMAAMGNALRDPGDRVIVATARVHRLRLLTADQRIIESDLVPVVE